MSAGRAALVSACLALALAGAGAGGGERGAEWTAGEIAFPGVSGAAPLPGGRLLLTAGGRNAVFLMADAASRLEPGAAQPAAPRPGELLAEALEGRVALEDTGDAAGDGRGGVYLAGSHAQDRRGESPEARFRLGRLRFAAGGGPTEARQTGALVRAMVDDLPFLADAMRRTPAQGGLNVEGAAWSREGHLLLGLRSPTVTESRKREHGAHEDAVVLRVRNPEELFAEPARPALLADAVKLDLRGQGIRGMCADPAGGGFWLLAGLSPELSYPVTAPWSLWRWDGTGAPREAPLPRAAARRLRDPEAVAVLETGGGMRLLLVEPGAGSSRYLWGPAPETPRR